MTVRDWIVHDEKRMHLPELIPDCAECLRAENERLRKALNDIWSASRDEGLATMCNWMRARALTALQGDKII